MNDPALAFDAATHTYTLGGRALPSVTQVLGEARVEDFSGPWFSDAAKRRGSDVHEAVARDDEYGLELPDVDAELQPYVFAWRQFRADSQAVVQSYERAVCDETLGYAGTIDRLVYMPSQGFTLLDLKLGLYRSVGPQTAAYARCARHLLEDRPALKRAAILLRPNGTYKFEPLTDRRDEAVFLAALTLYQFRSEHGLTGK